MNTPRVVSSILFGIAFGLSGSLVAAQAVGDFDLYALDTHTGEVEQVTFTPGYGDYNASFSNSGKHVVHDYLDGATFSQQLAITDVETYETTPLGIAGDNAVWSPNGNYIAYAEIYDPDVLPLKLVVIPAGGGDPVMTRDWGLEPSWSNNSRRIAFSDALTGAIGTVSIDGVEILLDTAYAYGCNPDYSPDGKLIVYENFWCFFGWTGELMVVPVNEHGAPLGDAYPLTDGSYYATQPSFSNDGKTIVFSGDPDGDGNFGLFTVSVFGGPITVLRDVATVNEYDPAYSNNGRYVIFSSHAGEDNP